MIQARLQTISHYEVEHFVEDEVIREIRKKRKVND